MEINCKDPVILNQWHPVSSLDVLTVDIVENTILLESNISFQLNSKEEVAAWLSLDDEKTLLPARISYGFIWVSLEILQKIFSFFQNLVNQIGKM